MVHQVKLINVIRDFPEPEGPTKATSSPSLIFKSKLSKSVIDPLEWLKVFSIY